ncbi:hypothetical protein SCP_0203730 [Sparassis crispa]|uniref:Uncharacterized protein n=1 Tax=Sparassis crispa TaxID=139825 RepID=A0A401GAG0_9APHY|nr:hypothetical protein SCP_0203730 [Sparassis crispa]GBE79176.1 hypothetical protein SCP_0203730 [Sparassis crispa]
MIERWVWQQTTDAATTFTLVLGAFSIFHISLGSLKWVGGKIEERSAKSILRKAETTFERIDAYLKLLSPQDRQMIEQRYPDFFNKINQNVYQLKTYAQFLDRDVRNASAMEVYGWKGAVWHNVQETSQVATVLLDSLLTTSTEVLNPPIPQAVAEASARRQASSGWLTRSRRQFAPRQPEWSTRPPNSSAPVLELPNLPNPTFTMSPRESYSSGSSSRRDDHHQGV